MKVVKPCKKRVDFPLRLPQWIKDAIDARVNFGEGSRASLVEFALKKTYKLREPK